MLKSYLIYLPISITLLQVQSSFAFAYLLNKITSKKIDIELVNGPPQYYELKNKNYADMQSLPSSDGDQVLSATGAFSKIDNIEDYEWTAYIRRFGEGADPAEAVETFKDLWRSVFENNKVDVFNNMKPTLRNNLQIFSPDDLTASKIEFILNKFIKAE